MTEKWAVKEAKNRRFNEQMKFRKKSIQERDHPNGSKTATSHKVAMDALLIGGLYSCFV